MKKKVTIDGVTVKEFKEWLNNFPDETIIEIGRMTSSCWTDSASFSWEKPIIGKIDRRKFMKGRYGDERILSGGMWSGWEWIKDESITGKTVLRLGEEVF